MLQENVSVGKPVSEGIGSTSVRATSGHTSVMYPYEESFTIARLVEQMTASRSNSAASAPVLTLPS
jgi:hypothetical protein